MSSGHIEGIYLSIISAGFGGGELGALQMDREIQRVKLCFRSSRFWITFNIEKISSFHFELVCI